MKNDHPVTKSFLLSLRNAREALAISVPTAFESVFGKADPKVCDERLTTFASNVVANADVHVTVVGRENMVPGVTHLIMSNHQSLYDIPILYYALGSNMRMVTKGELFAVPIFGAALRGSGFVRIDRRNRKQAIGALGEAKKIVESGVNIWLAPEGTRSRTGKLGSFKKGGFILAVETSMPVLPVSISGTNEILSASGFRSKYGVDVRVTIHPPIDPSSYVGSMVERRDQLMVDVRKAFERGLT